MNKYVITEIKPIDKAILMDTMRGYVNTQDEPKVRMFWYNPESDELIGVESAYASELQFNNKGRKSVKALRRIQKHLD